MDCYIQVSGGKVMICSWAIEDGLVLYNFDKQTFINLSIPGFEIGKDDDVGIYLESLVSPNRYR